jgi:tetratricopeptide (TPR) repeat protein
MRIPIAAMFAVALAAGCAATKEEQAVASMRDAIVAAEAHDLDGAKAAAERAAELRPGFVDPLMTLAWIAEQQGDLVEARRRYSQVLQYDPTDTAAGVAMGYTYLREAKFDDAKSWFAKAIVADPGFEAAAYNLGSVNEQQEDLETAVAWFEIAATLDARDPRALAHIGSIRLSQGRAEDALAAADAALKRYPASKSAQIVRAMARRALGRE